MQASAIDMSMVRFHNVGSDTTFINNMLIEVAGQKLATPNQRVADIAQRFVGTPYVAHTLEGEPEMLTVNVDELDCTTLVETVLAMAMTVGERRNSWRDFIYNLERIRYRNGTLNGYPSRLHYNCDWLVDNAHRGVISDATADFPRVSYVMKSIDYMSANADKYPALADSATLEAIKDVERGYRGFRIPYVKTVDLASKATKAELRSGDIVALVSNIKNLDVTHLGIIIKVDGEPYLLHASMSGGQVMLSAQPFADYMKRNRSFLGARIYRLRD